VKDGNRNEIQRIYCREVSQEVSWQSGAMKNGEGSGDEKMSY
jgi:hypothetical protein